MACASACETINFISLALWHTHRPLSVFAARWLQIKFLLSTLLPSVVERKDFMERLSMNCCLISEHVNPSNYMYVWANS